MRIAVMQPYFYAYIGYFELINSADVFVFLTDVQYIRRAGQGRGWVNRNRVRSANRPFQYITVPVKKNRHEALIGDIEIAGRDWCQRHAKTFRTIYGGSVVDHPLYANYVTLGRYDYLRPMLCDTIKEVCCYLNIGVEFQDSAGISANHGHARIIDLCKHFRADTCINLPGGKELYDPELFRYHGIKIQFTEMTQHENKLSILDLCFGDGLQSLNQRPLQREA